MRNYILQVTIESRHNATEYGSMLIDKNGSIIGSSLSFDPTQEHIYVMTARKVSGVTAHCIMCRAVTRLQDNAMRRRTAFI